LQTTRDGQVLGPEFRIPVLEALRAVTSDAAWQNFEEKRKGSIEPGKLADFVILDRNPLTVPPAEIRNLTVLETIVGGETVYTATAWFPPPDSAGGWRTADPAEAGMDAKALDNAFEYIQGSTKHGGLLVVRHGRLVYERYFGRAARDVTPNTASCGKTFTSIAMGILMAERPELFPNGLDQEVYTPRYLPGEAFPVNDPRKAGIKLGQLLSMTAGLRGAAREGRLTRSPPLRLVPRLPNESISTTRADHPCSVLTGLGISSRTGSEIGEPTFSSGTPPAMCAATGRVR
jgi:hypothetical protein